MLLALARALRSAILSDLRELSATFTDSNNLLITKPTLLNSSLVFLPTGMQAALFSSFIMNVSARLNWI